MLNIKQLREELIRPTLNKIGLWSRSAENLIIGTGLIESKYEFIKQVNGPALSFWQIEPATYKWLLSKLKQHSYVKEKACALLGYEFIPSDPTHLMSNMQLAIIMCRMRYFVVPTGLPHADNIIELSKYWGRHYQSQSIPEKMDLFVHLYDIYGEHLSI